MNKISYTIVLLLLSSYVSAADNCSYGVDSTNKSNIGKFGVSYESRKSDGYSYSIESSLSGTPNMVKQGESISVLLNTSNMPANAKPSYLWRDYCSGKIKSTNKDCTQIKLTALESEKEECILQVEIQDGLGNVKLDNFSYSIMKKDTVNTKSSIKINVPNRQVIEGKTITFTIGFDQSKSNTRTITLKASSGIRIYPQTITIPANSTAKKTITLSAIDDQIVNGNRTATITASSSFANTPAKANITIIDNDSEGKGKDKDINFLPGLNLPDMTISSSVTKKYYRFYVQNKSNEAKSVRIKVKSRQGNLLNKPEFSCTTRRIAAGRTGDCSILLKFDTGAPSGRYTLNITGTASRGAYFSIDKTINVRNTIKNRNYSVTHQAKSSIKQKLGATLDHAPVVIHAHGDGDCSSVPYKLWLQHLQSGQKQVIASGNVNACHQEVHINNARKTKLTKTGTYKFWAEIYPTGFDANKADNKTTAMTITVEDAKKPDLTIASISVPSSAKVNVATNGLVVSVRNSGAKTSTATRMGVYLSNNSNNGGKVGLSDQKIAFFNVSAILANRSQTFRSSFKATQAGKKWVYACVSAIANEASQGNNCSISKPITIIDTPKLPDLQLVSYHLSASPTVGQVQTVSMVIANNGQQTSSATTVGFYTSSNTVMDANDQRLALVNVPAIAKGTSKTVSARITFKKSGSAWLFACVSPVTGEQNTGNNCSALKKETIKSINNGRDDFYISSPRLYGSRVQAGGRITARGYQIYSGTSRAYKRPYLGYYLSRDRVLNVGDKLLATDISYLNASRRSNYESASLKIPSTTTAGQYYILLVADYKKSYAESNEANNVQAMPLYVTGAATVKKDDFYISSPRLYGSRVKAGDRITARGYQIYSGTSRAYKRPYLGYYLSRDRVLNVGDKLLATDISYLNASRRSNYESASLKIPSTTTAGQYYILLVADYKKSYAESNEANNVQAMPLYVTGAATVKRVSFKNKWRQNNLSVGGTSQWVVKPKGNGYSNLCNTANKCLHIQYGTLRLGTIQSGWLSAQWKIESAGGGYSRIRSRKNPSQFIHVEYGSPVAGTIKSGWWSALWKRIGD